ncbi:hypothetical protein [Planococcus sp. ISL-109]|uniref:hypothetical protein n=1 Tax=Planococcus sp. ISL-109 TaxID=2819166 RepID=UPI001BE5F107|nr:hypothetical protein [Planococcus sp. ISL-109]MBT2582638.1 hypothetical protein [Planococcus sp. ISL-109]
MNQAKLEATILHAGVESAEFLGEGAWHDAWKVSMGNRELVLRIPKETVYGKRVFFNEEELKAEYAGTELYYRSVNQAVPGAAPEVFQFHVSEKLSYTLESFVGQQIDLHEMTETAAYQTGKTLGEIYRKTEQIPHGLDGFGYLYWSEQSGLRGSITGDVQRFLQQESEEHLSDYRVLSEAKPEFRDDTVSDALKLAAEIRRQRFTKPLLSNQDASPENILMNGTQICLIDPFPSIYYPRGMAGNFMNLYETLFIALSDTERYRKHEFAMCADNLKGVANGFLDGYSAGDKQIAAQVRGEQLLQLQETAFSHFHLLSEDLPEQARIRYGNKQQIESRLTLLAGELKALAASEIGHLADSLIHLSADSLQVPTTAACFNEL